MYTTKEKKEKNKSPNTTTRKATNPQPQDLSSFQSTHIKAYLTAPS